MMQCDERTQLISKLTRIMLTLQQDIKHYQQAHVQQILSLQQVIQGKDEEIHSLRDQLEASRKYKTDVTNYNSNHTPIISSLKKIVLQRRQPVTVSAFPQQSVELQAPLQEIKENKNVPENPKKIREHKFFKKKERLEIKVAKSKEAIDKQNSSVGKQTYITPTHSMSKRGRSKSNGPWEVRGLGNSQQKISVKPAKAVSSRNSSKSKVENQMKSRQKVYPIQYYSSTVLKSAKTYLK